MTLSLESKEGAGNAGCALHPRSRVQDAQRNAHTGSAEAIRHSLRNGLTAYAVLSPATNSSCHRRRRIKGFARPGWIVIITDSLTSATDARTTRFCRTRIASFVLRAVVRSRKTALRTTLRADAAASTASSPAFVTIAIRPSCRERTGRADSPESPDGLSEIFFQRGLDSFC